MRTRILSSFLGAALVVGAATVHAQNGVAPQTPDLKALDSTPAPAVRDRHITGLAVGVVKGGRVVFSRGYGVRSLGDPAPITTRSLFHMASVTKPFVATAIMQLVEKGSVSLDSPVVRYLPYFKVRDT